MGTKTRSSHDDFDPWLLHSAFEKAIKDLEDKNNQMEKKVEKLEQACKDEDRRHWQRVAELQKKNQVSQTFTFVYQLELKMGFSKFFFQRYE